MDAREIQVPAGTIRYREAGAGPAIVFVHGYLVDGRLWDGVAEALSGRFHVVVPDLPFGAHKVPMAPDAALDAPGLATIVDDFIAALGLEDVTLVGNDSGGAYSQISVAADPGRVARLVLNSCETPFDEFPPPPFDGLPAAAADPAVLSQLFEALRDRDVRATDAAFGLLIKPPIDDLVSDSYALPCVSDADVLRDTAKVMSSAASAPVHAAGQSDPASDRPNHADGQLKETTNA